MQRPLRIVRANEDRPSVAELALAELATLRNGLDRLEDLTNEILAEKRRRLDQLECLILATADAPMEVPAA